MGKLIIGIDEAGRGPWAGPLLVVAVAGEANKLKYCQDSKSLSPKKRAALVSRIRRDAEGVGLGWASSEQIDEVGLAEALHQAAGRAFSSLSKPNLSIVIDGPYDFLKHEDAKVQTVVKADQTNPVVSAASIVAKVVRDDWMTKIAKKHSHWGFEKHKGYGTAEHRQLITKHGLSPIHRRSFKPIAEYENSQHLHRSSSRNRRRT